jgi:hypothetical protein
MRPRNNAQFLPSFCLFLLPKATAHHHLFKQPAGEDPAFRPRQPLALLARCLFCTSRCTAVARHIIDPKKRQSVIRPERHLMPKAMAPFSRLSRSAQPTPRAIAIRSLSCFRASAMCPQQLRGQEGRSRPRAGGKGIGATQEEAQL